MSECIECDYEQRTGLPVPDGIVHHCDEHKAEEHDEELEPDGRWVFSTEAGCWLYE